ncbi:MAG: GumC family protein [Verrucomicrobiales bacterium]|nr:hypothetical protein [Verrucomicrobiota bacterium JB025]
MQKHHTNAAPKGGIGVQDILIGLFKHKWMILGFGLLGLGGAAFMHQQLVPLYQSQAKLLVEYVLQRGSEGTMDSMSKPGSGSRWGDPVINTEIEILNSVDLAYDVAQEFGVEKLMPEVAARGGTVDPSAAAGVVLGGMSVNPGQSAKVIYINYGHENPDLAQSVLGEIVEQYLRRHLEIHRSKSRFEVVSRETERLKNALRETKFKLDELRMKSGIMNLTDATDALTSLRVKTQEDLMEARADLAKVVARMGLDGKGDGNGGAAAADPEPDEIPLPVLSEYQSLNEIIEMLRKRDVELQLKFKPGNPLMTRNRSQIDLHERKRQALLDRYPDLELAQTGLDDPAASGKAREVSEKSQLATAKAKIKLLEGQLEEIGAQFRREYQIGAEIDTLARQREALEEEYRTSESDLKNAKRDVDLDPARIQNITILQKPSEPIKTFDKKGQMIVLGLAGGGFGLGIALALLIELFIDRRVKRPIEIQTRLQLPLLLTIPFVRKGERGGLLLGSRDEAMPLLENTGEEGLQLSYEANDTTVLPTPGANGHFILPYSETIRDRIIFNFEINNVTHKPKLLAVTGLSEGAGASTVAAGLAKSFADVPGMKVLLVDLSSSHPEDSPLFGEITGHSLNGALRLASGDDFRDSPQNLYLASAPARRNETGITTFSPMHLYELMPSLLKSDYDYIIFDMPPVDQTSRTMTMAGMMDKVLLVLDAENTSRDRLQWGFSELVKGKADVSCVFNKTRSHVPEWLLGSN